jgi:hypothetical protein
MARWCSVMAYDYLDFDVFLNVRTFYAAAGYKVSRNWLHPKSELVVILRGNPQHTLLAYRNRVHIYDYVKELAIDWKQELPQASSIQLISIQPPEQVTDLPYIHGYLPVVSEIWQRPIKGKRNSLVHIANFKFHMKDDPYQQELVRLLDAGKVQAYGGKWENVNIKTKKLSYHEANATLARSLVCIGLMHPYQRGVSLSGRMWQAPLNGCAVISEQGTNILGCPGVIEVGNFKWSSIQELLGKKATPEALAREARQFWEAATRRLAADLGEVIPSSWPLAGLLRCRLELLLGHGWSVIGELRSRLIGPRRFWLGLRRRLQRISGRSL